MLPNLIVLYCLLPCDPQVSRILLCHNGQVVNVCVHCGMSTCPKDLPPECVLPDADTDTDDLPADVDLPADDLPADDMVNTIVGHCGVQ
jgi:hypothetical protein